MGDGGAVALRTERLGLKGGIYCCGEAWLDQWSCWERWIASHMRNMSALLLETVSSKWRCKWKSHL